MELTKYEKGTENTIEGVKYLLRDSEGNEKEYVTDEDGIINLNLKQEEETKLIQNAYKEWKNKGNKGPEEEFRKSISQYANGIQKDGGVSYHETFAEAIADIYCNGDNASDASKAIVNQILKKING